MARRASARDFLAAARVAPRTLRRLSPIELVLLVEAPFALPLAAVALRRYGLRRVQRFLERWPPGAAKLTSGTTRLDVARRLTWIVYVASAYGPWPANCLQRSLVLWWYLRRRGLSGELRIGVRRDAITKNLAFHAWIEYDGHVLNDDPSVRTRYATFGHPIAPTGASFA